MQRDSTKINSTEIKKIKKIHRTKIPHRNDGNPYGPGITSCQSLTNNQLIGKVAEEITRLKKHDALNLSTFTALTVVGLVAS